MAMKPKKKKMKGSKPKPSAISGAIGNNKAKTTGAKKKGKK